MDLVTLKGSSVAVTGASSGIGRAIAERLGADGAHVVLFGRTEAPMLDSARSIEAAGGSADVLTGDVREPSDVAALAERAASRSGHLDVFVNNAGVSFLGSMMDQDVEQWRAMLDTNVLALLVGCKEAVRAMRAGGGPGRIVNVSSVAALSRESGVYGATKHAVNVINETLRGELAEDPIQVTSVMPGLVATNIGRNADPELINGLVAMSGIEATFTPGERLPDEVLAAAQQALSELMIAPEDIADAVHYVCTRPRNVHIPEIVVRPNRDFDL